jgi:outer membrane protein assembly factor BamE
MVTNRPPKYAGFGASCALVLRGLRCGLVVAVIALLGACSGINFPYRAEVVQGNVVTKEQIQALRPGMPRQVVKDIMGTPLVTSMFHDGRWDYAFTIKRQGVETQQRRVSLYFQGNQLVRIEGDSLPTEVEFAAGIDVRKPANTPLPMKATTEQLDQYPRPNNPISAPTAQVPVRKSYPPLESSTQ